MRNPHNGEMDIVKIRKGLEKPGKSQRGLAQALGVDPTAVSRLLNGQRQLKLSEVPKVEAYLASSTGPEPEKGTGASNAADLTSTGGVAFNKELPRLSVLGMAETGPDGWSLWNGDVIDTLPRPSFLAGAKDAYAVYITGNSMEHRYYAGEAAYIHPGRPVTVGAFVLVQLKPKADGDPPRFWDQNSPRAVQPSKDVRDQERRNPVHAPGCRVGRSLKLHKTQTYQQVVKYLPKNAVHCVFRIDIALRFPHYPSRRTRDACRAPGK